MIKKQFILTIEVEEETIYIKYPNFHINYKNAETFIEKITKGTNENSMERYGYRINTEPLINNRSKK